MSTDAIQAFLADADFDFASALTTADQNGEPVYDPELYVQFCSSVVRLFGARMRDRDELRDWWAEQHYEREKHGLNEDQTERLLNAYRDVARRLREPSKQRRG